MNMENTFASSVKKHTKRNQKVTTITTQIKFDFHVLCLSLWSYPAVLPNKKEPSRKKSHPSGSVQESTPFNSTHRWASLKVKEQGAWVQKKWCNIWSQTSSACSALKVPKIANRMLLQLGWAQKKTSGTQHLRTCPLSPFVTCDDTLKLRQAESKLSNPPALEIRRFQVTPPASLRPLVCGPTGPHWAYQASNSEVATTWHANSSFG